MLQRGFWLYVWRAEHPRGTFLYVGRTGDNPAPNAASPYNRLGQHLGANKNASALKNHLDKHLGNGEHKNVTDFHMVCYGPVLPEVMLKQAFDALPEADREEMRAEHVRQRDLIGALEKRLAEALQEAGYLVLNTVRNRNEPDPAHWTTIRDAFTADFPGLEAVN